MEAYTVIAIEFSISSLRAPAKQSSTERCPKYVLDCFAGARNDGLNLKFIRNDYILPRKAVSFKYRLGSGFLNGIHGAFDNKIYAYFSDIRAA